MLGGKREAAREVWQDATRKVVRYNLAFINHFMHGGDNGRVLGYDIAHGFHHRHFMGKVEKEGFRKRSLERARKLDRGELLESG